MKVSYAWLNSYFDNTLPPVDEVVSSLTFHAWEVEDVTKVGEDTVFEVKVLPDRAAFALSHRGIAKDLSVVLNKPLTRDPLAPTPDLTPLAPNLSVSVETAQCTTYAAALVTGVKVGPSPQWLKDRLEALGQRSINNVVDATNYVMFDCGQPLHAFDAEKITGTTKAIVVRNAHAGEKITTLTGESYELAKTDALIVDATNDTALGIAGIKGGQVAAVDQNTSTLVIESANFDALTTRLSSQRLKLRTDASQRYENSIRPETTHYALSAVVQLITEVAGGKLVGYQNTAIPSRTITPVSMSLAKAEKVLGVTLGEDTARSIIERFGYEYTLGDGILTVTPPWERNDLLIPEDLIEEIGRIYGYEHVPSKVPKAVVNQEINKRFWYSEAVRDTLTGLGFSEVYTSSFRERDVVKMKNAFASDKGYLRSSLRSNLVEALARNVPHRDLLGLSFVGVFEIGTVFTESEETFALAVGVRHGMEYKEKTDKKKLDEALEALRTTLGVDIQWDIKDGVAECNFGSLLPQLPEVTTYKAYKKPTLVTFAQYSLYPAMSRDVALWVTEGTTAAAVETVLNAAAGSLRVRTTQFDQFTKEGRTSLAFRLVFQSPEKTLTDEEVANVIGDVHQAVTAHGWEVR